MSLNTEWKSIQYPITINYRSHWSEWESIRELIQNALDVSGSYTLEKLSDSLTISDTGEGLKVSDLLFGVTSKSGNSSMRGKFGEGLKIALIVLKRLGYEVEILSSNLELKASTLEIEGNQCLEVLYKKVLNDFKGTSIKILGYKGRDFSERFITSKTPKLFHSEIIGDILEVKEGEKAKLYVKDIYVCELDNAAFSYNLREVQLEESRNLASEYSLQTQIGFIWSRVSNKALMVQLLAAIRDKKYEDKAYFRDSFKYLPEWKLAFDELFPNTVLKTSDLWEREATWRNKNVIDIFDSYRHSSLFAAFPRDIDFVTSSNNLLDIAVDEKNLNLSEARNLAIARKIALRIDETQKLTVCLMEDSLGKSGNPIKLNRSILANLESTLSTLIHELTHTYYGSDDLTKSMFHNLSNMAAKVLAEYVNNEFSTTLLTTSNNGNTTQYRVTVPKSTAMRLSIGRKSKVRVSIAEEE